MKLSAVLDNYYALSGILSEVNRQLSFAGIAVIWIFKVSGNGNTISLPHDLQLPLLFLVASLAFDLLHYAIATLAWGMYHREQDRKKVDADDEVTPPDWINRPAIFFVGCKVLCNIAGLVLLLSYIWILLR